MTGSNLYASRLYADHPIGLWPIDDDLGYLSLISSEQGNLLNWSATCVVNGVIGETPEPPMPYENVYVLDGSGTAITTTEDGDFYIFGVESDTEFDITSFNQDMGSFTMSANFYTNVQASFYEIGYSFVDPTDGYTEVTVLVEAGPQWQWNRATETFPFDADDDLPIKLIVRAWFDDNSDLTFYVNGLSFGQWAESFVSTSTGVTPQYVADNIGIEEVLGATQAVPIAGYSPGSDSAYAIVEDGRLLAVNQGVPMVFGSESLTSLVASPTGKPSMVFPGYGMLNDSGRFNTYTFETWLRLNNTEAAEHRIMGPLTSSDGVYVNGSCIALVVGDNVSVYNVSNWYRPMLLHLILQPGEASLSINGEKVASVPFVQNSLVLPENSIFNEDWIGFYMYDDLDLFEIDTVSIFPYVVPDTVKKRRFAQGQGVDSPEAMNKAFQGVTTSIGLPYAKYTSNAKFPDTIRWDSGFHSNLQVNQASITSPPFSLPKIELGQKTVTEMCNRSFNDWAETGDPFFTFKSSTEYAISPSYLYFEKLNILPGREKIVFGYFSTNGENATLFNLSNGSDTLTVALSGLSLTKLLNGEIVSSEMVTAGDRFLVWIDLDEFGFSPSDTYMYVGGTGSTTFSGHIYKVGLIDDQFDTSSFSFDTIPSYAIVPVYAYGKYLLDIQTSGVWEDNIPLTYFGKIVNGASKLDLVQFNVSLADGVYITLQDLTNRRKTLSEYTNEIESDQICTFEDWETTKFRVYNDTVLLPPMNPSLSLVIHVDAQSSGIKTQPFVLREMALLSKTAESGEFPVVGSVTGTDMISYTKNGNYFNPNIDKPFLVYKDSTPYLYLTNDSGIRPLYSIGDSTESGLMIPVNSGRTQDYNVSAMQIWMRYVDDSDDTTELFSVRAGDVWIKFVAEPDGNGRARLYATNGWTDDDYTSMTFFQDGKMVITPYLVKGRWTAIGINFEPVLAMSGLSGGINLLGGAVFNNIVFYKTPQLQLTFTYLWRTWMKVRQDGTDGEPAEMSDLRYMFDNLDEMSSYTFDEIYAMHGPNLFLWEYWKLFHEGANDGSWDTVCKAATISHGISIERIYKTYTGTNRFVVGNDDKTTMWVSGDDTTIVSGEIVTDGDQISVVNSPKWTSFVRKPA